MDNLILISSIIFSSLISLAANYGSLSEIMLSDNLYNFYILSLNRHTSSSAIVLSVIATKFAIFDNLLHTTRIASFSVTSSNLVIKLTIKCIHSFSKISFAINFPARSSV